MYSMHPQSVHMRTSFVAKAAAATTTILYVVKNPISARRFAKSGFYLCGIEGAEVSGHTSCNTFLSLMKTKCMIL